MSQTIINKYRLQKANVINQSKLNLMKLQKFKQDRQISIDKCPQKNNASFKQEMTVSYRGLKLRQPLNSQLVKETQTTVLTTPSTHADSVNSPTCLNRTQRFTFKNMNTQQALQEKLNQKKILTEANPMKFQRSPTTKDQFMQILSDMQEPSVNKQIRNISRLEKYIDHTSTSLNNTRNTMMKSHLKTSFANNEFIGEIESTLKLPSIEDSKKTEEEMGFTFGNNFFKPKNLTPNSSRVNMLKAFPQHYLQRKYFS